MAEFEEATRETKPKKKGSMNFLQEKIFGMPIWLVAIVGAGVAFLLLRGRGTSTYTTPVFIPPVIQDDETVGTGVTREDLLGMATREDVANIHASGAEGQRFYADTLSGQINTTYNDVQQNVSGIYKHMEVANTSFSQQIAALREAETGSYIAILERIDMARTDISELKNYIRERDPNAALPN